MPPPIRGFSPGRLVEESIVRALHEGERLVTGIRLVTALILAATWPLTEVLEPAIAPRQQQMALVCAAVAAASLLGLGWLRSHAPQWRFAALSVSLDLSLVTGILLVILLWSGPHYVGLPTVVGMPSVCLAMAAAGLRLFRRPAAIGIVLGWLTTAGMLVLDVALFAGPYPAGTADLLGVAINLSGASLVCWAMSSRARRWIGEAASLAVVAARSAQRLGAYLPRAVAEATLAEDAPLAGAERATVAVMFTRLSALPNASGQDGGSLVDEVNEYFQAVTSSVQAAGGVIDKYRHDGVMAVFGAPIADPDAARRAVIAAETMQAALEQLNQRRARAGRASLSHGVGIHYGPVALGNLGTRDRLSFTVIGDAVNVAARMAALAEELGESTVLSKATVNAAEREAGGGALPSLRSIGEHALRGRRAPVTLYALSRRPGTLPPPPSGPSTASWDAQPSSLLVSGAWKKASLQAARAAARAGASVAESVFDRAALDAECWVAWVRVGVGTLAIVLARQLASGEQQHWARVTLAVAGAMAVLSSAAILKLTRRSERPGLLLGLAPLLDAGLVFAALLALMIWPTPSYQGITHVTALGLLYIVILAGGIRMRARSVVLSAALASAAAIALVWIDARRGVVASPLDVASVAILLIGSTAAAYAAVVRSRRLVTAVARQARDAARARARLGAYVSDAVAEHALDSAELELGGRYLERVAVLACDLRGFTRYAEDLDPQELVAQLNGYFEAMAEPVREQRGVIDSFVGDALLVVFGAPKPSPRPALRALLAAAGMRRALARHNQERARRGLPPLAHGIGVHLGPAVAGHIGTAERATFAVVGPVLTEAEALEQAAKEQASGVLVSEVALAAARAEAAGADLPSIAAEVTVARAAGKESIRAHALA